MNKIKKGISFFLIFTTLLGVIAAGTVPIQAATVAKQVSKQPSKTISSKDIDATLSKPQQLLNSIQDKVSSMGVVILSSDLGGSQQVIRAYKRLDSNTTATFQIVSNSTSTMAIRTTITKFGRVVFDSAVSGRFKVKGNTVILTFLNPKTKKLITVDLTSGKQMNAATTGTAAAAALSAALLAASGEGALAGGATAAVSTIELGTVAAVAAPVAAVAVVGAGAYGVYKLSSHSEYVAPTVSRQQAAVHLGDMSFEKKDYSVGNGYYNYAMGIKPVDIQPVHIAPIHINPIHIDSIHIDPINIPDMSIAPIHIDPIHIDPIHIPELNLNSNVGKGQKSVSATSSNASGAKKQGDLSTLVNGVKSLIDFGQSTLPGVINGLLSAPSVILNNNGLVTASSKPASDVVSTGQTRKSNTQGTNPATVTTQAAKRIPVMPLISHLTYSTANHSVGMKVTALYNGHFSLAVSEMTNLTDRNFGSANVSTLTINSGTSAYTVGNFASQNTGIYRVSVTGFDVDGNTKYSPITTGFPTWYVNTNTGVTSLLLDGVIKRQPTPFPVLDPLLPGNGVVVRGKTAPYSNVIIQISGQSKKSMKADKNGVFIFPGISISLKDTVTVWVTQPTTKQVLYTTNTSNPQFDKESKAYQTEFVKEVPNLSVEDLRAMLPTGWKAENHNGFVHIKDPKTAANVANRLSKLDKNSKEYKDLSTSNTQGYRVRIDPADSVTKFTHIHVYNDQGQLLNEEGQIVNYNNPAGHIRYDKPVPSDNFE